MEIDDLFSKLKPVMGEKLERIRLAYLAEDADGQREIEMMLRILYARQTKERINQGRILLPPPDAKIAQGELVLGDVVYNDKRLCPVGLDRGELLQHTALFGRSGSGKTNTVLQMISELLRMDIPFLIFDWKRNYRDTLSLTDKEILVFTVGRPVAPIQFNPLIPPPGVEPQVHLKFLVNIIAKAYYCGDGVISLLQQALDHVYRESGMYEGAATKIPVMQDVLNYLETAPVKGRAANWMASTLRAVRSLCFGQMGRVINCEKSLPLGELLSKNVVLELDALEGAEKAFFIDAFLLAIYHYRMNEPDREVLKHVIILEEAHHVLRAHEGAETVSEVMLREVRELGEGIILIDQHPSLIALTALGNTFCTITMNLKTRADLNAAASYTLLGRDDIHFLGELKVGQGIVKLQDRYLQPFLVNFPLIRIKKGIITDQAVIEKMRGYLADTTPPGPPNVKTELSPPIPPAEDKKNIYYEKSTTSNSQELSFLKDVLEHPESGIVERIKTMNLSRRKVQAIKAALVARGWLEAVGVSTGTGRTVLLALTTGGKAVLRQSGIQTAGYLATGGVEHEFWVRRIAEKLENDGYSVTREFKIPGDGNVDLVAEKDGRRMAIEIETGQSDIDFNVRKCLEAGFDRVILAATTRETYGKILPRMAAEFSTEDRLEIVNCPSRF